MRTAERRRGTIGPMSTPARPLGAPAPRAGEYAQRRLADLGLTPEELAAEDLDLSPPLTPEEQAEFLRDAETWAPPEVVARFRATFERMGSSGTRPYFAR